MTPTICGKMYGIKTGSRIYGIVFFFLIPSGVIGLILSNTLYNYIGYGKIFYITASTSIVSFIMLMFYKNTARIT